MPRQKYTEDKIIPVLKRHENGEKTVDLCRELSISQNTFYKWKAKYGGMDLSEAKRLKSLEEENRKLKRIVADQALDIMGLKEIARGNF